MSVDIVRAETGLDITDPDLFADGIPHKLFKTLRQKAPVLWTDAPADWPEEVGRGQWNVTRAADIRTASRRADTFSSCLQGVMMDNRDAGGVEMIQTILLGKDGKDHSDQRAIVDDAFFPARVAKLEDSIRETVTRHMDAFIQAGPGDAVESFTKAVPLDVICDVMGIPQDYRAQVFAWAQTVVADNDPELIALYGRPEEGRKNLYNYVEGLIKERAGCPRDDLATFFATTTVGGRPVPDQFRSSLFQQLLEAGADTTMNSMSFGIQAFSEFPDQWQILLDDRSFVPNAVEEILRWASTVAYFRRTASEDTELGGQLIREGDSVILWYASGNRDEEAFEHADTFDVTREKCPHFAFGGGGRHYCVGANLARLEIRVMLETLLDRVPDLKVSGPVKRTRGNNVLGVTSLPVTFSAR